MGNCLHCDEPEERTHLNGCIYSIGRPVNPPVKASECKVDTSTLGPIKLQSQQQLDVYRAKQVREALDVIFKAMVDDGYFTCATYAADLRLAPDHILARLGRMLK